LPIWGGGGASDFGCGQMGNRPVLARVVRSFLKIIFIVLPQNEYYNTSNVLRQITRDEWCPLAKVKTSGVHKQISILRNVLQQNYPFSFLLFGLITHVFAVKFVREIST
jgi:hypothetical protein